jgi:hypothetical protein
MAYFAPSLNFASEPTLVLKEGGPRNANLMGRNR